MSEKPEALRLADDPTESKEMYLFMQAAELHRLHAENERLKAALPYDWDQLEACRGSLREHMAEIKRLTADNERLRDELRQSSIDHTRAEVERLTATAFQAQNAAIDLAQRYKRLKGLLREAREYLPEHHPVAESLFPRIEAALRREET